MTVLDATRRQDKKNSEVIIMIEMTELVAIGGYTLVVFFAGYALAKFGK